MRARFVAFSIGTAIAGLLAACGAIKDKVNEVSNGLNVQGHWLMTESEHASRIEKAIENESVVLTFKDGKAAFSPTDSVKGKAVYTALSNCTAGPRPYRTENNDIVLDAIAGCPEKRVAVQRLDGDRLKFPDPANPDITRTFTRIDDNRYQALVKASDRRP